MADTKISALAAKATPAAADLLVLVDVTDTTMASTGTDKKATVAQLAASVATTLGLGTAATHAATDFDAAGAAAAVTKSSIGLGSVDNTSDAGKPVSTATAAALANLARPVNAQTGTTYTFVLSDSGKLVTGTNASAQTYTVPPNSSVAFAVNAEIDLAQLGAGQVTIAAGAGVTIQSYQGKLAIAGQFAGATLKKLATDSWLLIGNLS